jgi:DNA polymerase II small subunit
MGVRKEIVDFFQKQGMLIQPDAIEFLAHANERGETFKHLFCALEEKPFIISLEFVKQLIGAPEGQKRTREKTPQILTIGDNKPIKKSQLKIIRDITGNSTCESSLKDFVHLFENRFDRLSELIKKRQAMRNASSIRRIPREDKEVAIIGMVKDITSSKNGVIVELEDKDATISAYVPRDVDGTLVNDEIIGVLGKKKGDIIMVKNVIRPELPVERKQRFSHEEEYVMLLSDLHVGNKSFLEKEWNRFITWINGKNGSEKQREIVKKIKYIIMSGDLVDGIGIYPDQENDLIIEDIYEQYKDLGKKIAGIPSDIKLIMQPGNHDAVRSAIPQPSFQNDIKDLLGDRDIVFVGNPCYLEIDGVLILSYHGQSIQDFATCIPNMTQNKPGKIMVEMLKRRHMAPIYGGVSSLAPEAMDYMVIDHIPDIFVTGHVHVTSVETYRRLLLVNASAWMSQTDYQRMMNLIPDPAKSVIVNLKDLSPRIMNFA